MTKQITNS